MDKPISQVNKIILEEDKEFQLYVTISIQQMGVISGLVGENTTTHSLSFTEIGTAQVPLKITLKKNPDTMEQLIEESIIFNTRHDWQKEVPYKNGL